MATQYTITTNGVTIEKTYGSKDRAITEAQKIADAGHGLTGEHTISVETVKTRKCVWIITIRNMEESPAADAPVMDESVSLGEETAEPMVPTVAVIQDRPGMSSITHYHSPECRDTTREMRKWGQSQDDVLRAYFSSVAEILEFEFGDIASDRNPRNTPDWWESIVDNSNELVRIMPCLSHLPAGMAGDLPLIITDNNFRFGVPPLCAWIDPACGCERFADPAEVPCPDHAGFTETLVTKEYHLSVCVDELTGARVDLGWHTFTMNAAQAHDTDKIADAYGKVNGSGTPRHGWGSVITVLEVCDI